jgi:hypothetical protein
VNLPETVQVRVRESRGIENCRGDFAQISELIEKSWAENTHPAFYYGPEFLASCFEYPGASFTLAPAIYEGAAPLAFVAAFPRRVLLQGRQLQLAIVTLLTVAREHKKSGIGIVLWNEIVERLRHAGFDGMLNYCLDGESMNGMIEGCCRMLRLPTARAFSVAYWSRVLHSREAPNDSADWEEGTVERFLELTAPIARQTPLARLWSREEAEWQCRRRFGAIAAELESGSRRGMLTGYITHVANESRTRCLMVEDVLWGALEPHERDVLVKKFLDQAVAAGAQIAALPVLGYADPQPFHNARFRLSQRVLHAYITIWNGSPQMESLPSMYLDVF